jgi:two-component system, OmpR family, response regulator MprA
MGRILIVEDESGVVEFLCQALRETGFETASAGSAEQTKAIWRDFHPELVLLDWRLPDIEGTDLLRYLRHEGLRAPVLMLTARTATQDRVEGLDAGADDYLVKPFHIDELLARIRALLRRPALSKPVWCGNLEVDLVHRKVARGGKVIFLSPTEFALLEILAERAGEAVDRQEILRRIWSSDDRDPNIVDVYITYLRKKTERNGETRLIQTVRGQGYSLRDLRATA